MSHCIRRIGTFSALLAMVAVSGIAIAEDSSEPSEARPPARNAGGRGDAKSPNERASDRRATDRRGAAPVVPARVNEAFTFPLTGGCEYSSTVRGTVRTARTPAGEEPKYAPNLTVNAWVSCQNNTEMRVIDSTLRESAMTRAELEQAIELRASLLSDNGAIRCAYVPDFSLAESKLSGVGVFFLCPGGGAQAGAGSLDDLPDDTTRPAAPAEGLGGGRSSPVDKPAEGRAPSSGRPAVENRPPPETRGAVDRRSIREKSSPDESH